MKVSFFNTAFIRTPLYPLEIFQTIPNEENELYPFIKSLWFNAEFREAIYLASPDLYAEWRKTLHIEPNIEIRKICISILKYFIRAITRATPFGLFSAYSLIKIGDNPPVKELQYERFSFLNIAIIYQITQLLNTLPSVRDILTYKLNQTIYKVGNDYRYIEVKTTQKKEHILSKFEADDVIELLFEFLKNVKECKLQEIVSFLSSRIDGVTEVEIQHYVDELIENQIIISNLDVSINSHNPLNQILVFFDKDLAKIKNNHHLSEILITIKDISQLLNDINENRFSDNIGVYREIEKKIAGIFNQDHSIKKNIVNINLKKNHFNFSYDQQDQVKITKALNILYTLTDFTENLNSDTIFNNFKEAFYKRFEYESVPLLFALDNELGVGYVQNTNPEYSELLDDIEWDQEKTDLKTLRYNSTKHRFWNKKILNALKNNSKTINLTDEDIKILDQNQKPSLSATFSVLFSMFNDKIFIEDVQNKSASALLGRFSSLDPSVSSVVQEIADHEATSQDSFLHCEILHIQDEKAGNVVARNVRRKHEIAFLTKGSDDIDQIELSDIYIFYHENKIILMSKKYNKQIKVYNSTVHNYSYNALPIYQFFSDYQNQEHRFPLHINIGSINRKAFRFFPRITYQENIVLSLAYWIISFDDLPDYTEDSLKKYLTTNQLPRYFYIVKGDNKLLIDTENPILSSILFSEVRNQRVIKLEEFIYDLQPNQYANEMVLSVKNEDIQVNTHKIHLRNNILNRKFIPGNSWLYYKIFTGTKTADSIVLNTLNEIMTALIDQQLIEKWFFIRYNDPEFHIRLRIKITSVENTAEVLNTLIPVFEKLTVERLIHNLELGTYKRELERYGSSTIDDVEDFFYHDTKVVIKLIKYALQNPEIPLWVYICYTVGNILNIFHTEDEKKIVILEQLADQFNLEFNVSKRLKKQIDRKYRSYKNIIADLLNEDLNDDSKQISKKLFNELKLIADKLCNKDHLLVSSIIHMHINRAINSNPRAHEMVIYNILLKHYRDKIALKKIKFNK